MEKNPDGIQVEATVAGLYESVKGFRYAFHEAIADIVDNSVDADASVVRIIVQKDRDRILLIDDGGGMSHEQLCYAAIPWKKKIDDHDLNGRGKYGIGLKGAGFSLADTIVIHTKKRGNDFRSVSVALSELSKWPENKRKIPIEYSETQTWKEFAPRGKVGTIIELKKLRQSKVTENGIQSLRSELGIIFFRLIEKDLLTITVNDAPIKALSPLLSELENAAPGNFYCRFSDETVTYTSAEGLKGTFKLSGAYVGRAKFWSNEHKKLYRHFLNKRGETNIREQGIFILRNNRLLTLGGWYGVRSFSHHLTPCRVILEYSAKADELLGIDHTKTKPEFDEGLKQFLMDKYVQKVSLESEKLFRKEGVKQQAIHVRDTVRDLVKKEVIDARPPKLDTLNKHDDKRNKVLPEVEKSNKRMEETVRTEAAKSDSFVELCDKLPWNALWSYAFSRDGEVKVMLNEKHPAFGALFLETDSKELVRKLCLFFYYMAYYEANFSELSADIAAKETELLKKHFAAFRKHVSRQFQDF